MTSSTSSPKPITSLRGHSAPVLCLATLPADPTTLASGAEDGTARIWDVARGRCRRGIRVGGAGEEVNSVCWGLDPNEVYVAAGAKVHAVDLRSPGVVITASTPVGPAADDDINQICLHEKGTFLAVADDSGQVRVLDMRTRRPFKRFRRGHDSLAMCVRFQPQTSWTLWSGGMDNTVIAWDYSKGAPVAEFDMASPPETSTSPSPSPTPEPTAPQTINPPFVQCMDFSPNGNILAAGLGDGALALIEPPLSTTTAKGKGKASGAPWMYRSRLEGGHTWSVAAMTFVPNSHIYNNSTLLTGGIDGVVAIWRSVDISSASPTIDTKNTPPSSLRLDTRYRVHRKVNCIVATVHAFFVRM
ncbi:WD40-repeat-containing domain protein [Fimicolochytrium jonesii]|uniref:WD40-repeat-containing domain protein n=1 Tax=Fimicolochytrium jonesii TaxID=1396493 RepID=UPI0022FE2FD1|nr:WD40-repeat-containing domain protein [Fimicolochytrium jonesii]KAI8818507.1 WD40-repeat-containing domain protein [Fimicolochytrium jonesii]